jgi:NAD(P)-dependent dehydrogenase (short-subunit alcohol dehydrogenase family)
MPGTEAKMKPEPACLAPLYKGSGKLQGKVALITGGDSGIGRSVAILYAREGANVAISYLDSHKDAEKTKELVEKEGGKCILLPGDICDPKVCQDNVEQTVQAFRSLDILVNNAGVQYKHEKFEEIDEQEIEKTFRTNIFSMFYLTKAALKHMKEGSCIINTTSVTSYKGSHWLVDYSATKGAIQTFTYSLSQNLMERGIRVNGVAPGPIWTPFIPATFSEDEVAKFGKDTPMGRAGQPEEVAPCFVFLASQADSSYISGQILHPNGGVVVHG